MSELVAELEFVCTYLDDLLILCISIFKDHLHHLEVVLQILKRAGLKVNAENLHSLQPEIKYLGYMLTTDNFKLV